MRRINWLLITVFVLGSLAIGARGPSTTEERQKFAAITHKLELAPLDASLHPDRDWAYKFLSEVPDLSVDVCTGGLGDFMKSRYQYTNEIVYQLMYSTATFMIEHPDKAKDYGNLHVAGVDGALKAYNSILKTQPSAKSPALDELVQKQHDGKLSDYVREATKSCH